MDRRHDRRNNPHNFYTGGSYYNGLLGVGAITTLP
jgi:hypothetical protein